MQTQKEYNVLPILMWASLVAQLVKTLPAMQETWVLPLGWEDPLEKGMATLSSILAWNPQEQRNLVGFSPWGRKELDMTERLSTHILTQLKALSAN